MGGVTLRCPTPELPDRNVTWFQAPDVKLSTGRELSVTDTGLYFCVGTDERGTFVSNYISVYNQGAPSNGELTLPSSDLGAGYWVLHSGWFLACRVITYTHL